MLECELAEGCGLLLDSELLVCRELFERDELWGGGKLLAMLSVRREIPEDRWICEGVGETKEDAVMVDKAMNRKGSGRKAFIVWSKEIEG